MGLPQRPPGGGAGNRRIHFPFICTPRAYSWEAYIAGPCHWFGCHGGGRSKPCLHEMTDGELACEYNHDVDEPITIGYQPLWQKDNGRPGFVIVYDHLREQIDKLRLHHLVLVARGKGKSDTVAINYKGVNSPMYHSTRADFMRPAELTESLLRIWKMPELVHWYRCTHGQSDNAVSLPPKPVPKLKPLKSDGKAFGPMTAAGAEKYAEGTPPPVAGATDAVLKRLQEQEARHRKNGHIDKPTE
jgi:hypothetical protein